jgi:RNA polymerase sigma factor (sigma-70 family)
VTVIRAESQPLQGSSAERAWAGVVALEREVGQQLLGYAIHLGVDHGRAPDLVQEALLRLWRELDRGTAVASPEAWTFRTLTHLVMDEHRFLRRSLRLLSRIGVAHPPRPTESDPVERVAVWSEVERLPQRQRQVVYLRFRADLSFDEIGSVMAITPGTARMHASLALATLRSRLDVDTESA